MHDKTNQINEIVESSCEAKTQGLNVNEPKVSPIQRLHYTHPFHQLYPYPYQRQTQHEAITSPFPPPPNPRTPPIAPGTIP